MILWAKRNQQMLWILSKKWAKNWRVGFEVASRVFLRWKSEWKIWKRNVQKYRRSCWYFNDLFRQPLSSSGINDLKLRKLLSLKNFNKIWNVFFLSIKNTAARLYSNDFVIKNWLNFQEKIKSKWNWIRRLKKFLDSWISFKNLILISKKFTIYSIDLSWFFIFTINTVY